MKVGRLICRNSEIQWKTNREETAEQLVSPDERSIPASIEQTRYSVVTPSYAQTARSMSHRSERPSHRSFAMANPNPQDKRPKYQGVREVGYSSFEKTMDPTDVIKFGKKVSYNTNYSN